LARISCFSVIMPLLVGKRLWLIKYTTGRGFFYTWGISMIDKWLTLNKIAELLSRTKSPIITRAKNEDW
jgi:hypothetical protein